MRRRLLRPWPAFQELDEPVDPQREQSHANDRAEFPQERLPVKRAAAVAIGLQFGQAVQQRDGAEQQQLGSDPTARVHGAMVEHWPPSNPPFAPAERLFVPG